MPRKSTRENGNIYLTTRNELGYSREKASEILGTLSIDQIQAIESGERRPDPDQVMVMAKGYKKPLLCNYYCANECEIGKKYVPEVKIQDLSQIVLETLASLNNIEGKRNRLIEITVDGHINDNEIDDFIRIQDELDHISKTANALKLWCEQMLAQGVIDAQKYESRRDNLAK